MRVLVTGGAGFIGSHLVDRLVNSNDSVIVLDNLLTGRIENIQKHLDQPNVQFVNGSILDESLVDAAVGQSDLVVHLAAAVGVNTIIDDPLTSLATNLRGSEIVTEMCVRHARKVLIASTSEIYGKNTSNFLSEDADRILGSPLLSRWSYSEAKALEELIAYTHWKLNNLPAIIIRLFNTVGPRQVGNYGMVVPRLVKQALLGEKLTVYGSGSQTRCFVHVDDVCVAIEDLTNSPDAIGEVFNVGSSEEISILDLAARIIDVTGSASQVEVTPYEDAYGSGFEDMQRRRPDTQKIKDLIGWEPTKGIDEIISDVADEISNELQL